ncbi:MAG: hypothetical protein RL596_882 [Bacteroidota bacterium]|jgi:hypothetical protein
MVMSKKSITGVLVIVCILGWIFFDSYKTKHLRKNFKIVNGRVTGITGTSYRNNNRSVFYDYKYTNIHSYLLLYL